MSALPADVHRLFALQHGVASVEQLCGSGLTARQIEHFSDRGDLCPMIRGVYASPSVPETEHARCAAVCVGQSNAVVAGPTAGRLWGFRNVGADRRIHVVVPRGRRSTIAEWCIAFATDAIHPTDIVQRSDGIRVTTRARTALDLTRHLRSDDTLLSVIEQAMHDGGLRDGDLRAVAVDWRRRRPWVRRFLAQLDRRLDGAAAESEPEVRVGQALHTAGIGGLVRQHPVLLPGYGPARFDIAVPEAMWALEVDVFPTHAETIGRLRDRARDRAATELGWRVHRIGARGYAGDFDLAIARAIADLARWRSVA
jgi:hypothetical protein